jgi:aminopeptidase N
MCLAPSLAAQQPGIDVVAYSFTLSIPDSGSEISGLAVIAIHRAGGGPSPDTLRLDLVGLSVDTVFGLPKDGPRRRLAARYDGRILSVPIRELEGRRFAVAIAYHGVPQDGLLIRPNARGERVAFADNWPERARHWLPTVDHPNDKATVAWAVDVPAGWRVVANGRPDGQQELPGGRRRYRWYEERSIPVYTMVLGAGKLSVSRHAAADSASGWVGVEVWSYPEDSAFADSVPFRRATEVVETMVRLVGPFPYGKLAHVESSTRYGGMENSSAIFYAEKPYVNRTMREGVVRHETAHQWFGDAVTAREWPHLWLSEGFASYFDLVIGAALDGDSVLAAGMRRNAASYFASAVVQRPVVDTAEHDPMRLLSANSYQKGAWVLHMLRGLVGDSTFFRGIREYYRVYRDSTAVSEDFQRVMEQAAGGRRLGWFFRQWLWQPGHPRLTVQWRYEPADRRVRLDLTQVQPDPWGVFRLPRVEVEAVTAGAKRVRRVFSMDARSIIAYLELDEAPVEVRVDPDGRLLLNVTPVFQ